MWEINNNFQLISFLISCGVGIVYCLIYDVLRAIRKSCAVTDGTVFLQDIVYFVIISITTFMLLTALSNGEIRSYVIIGLLLGFLLCFCTFSKINLKVLVFIFSKFHFLSDWFVASINAMLDTICRFLSETIEKTQKLLNNIKKIFKNHLKKSG